MSTTTDLAVMIASEGKFKALALAGKLAQNAEAQKGTTIPTGDGYVMESKFDGWRILAHVHEGGVTLFSRSGKTYSLASIEAELVANFPAGTWLDGEMAAYSEQAGGTITDKWHTVQSVLSSQATKKHGEEKVSYMVFDLLAHGGIDARPLPFGNRRALLARIFEGEGFDRVKLTKQYPASAATHEAFVTAGFEGSIVKRLDAKYASNRRGHGWMKIKPLKTVDGVVIGFQPGKDGFAGMVGAVIFGQHDENGVLVERGKVSGMDMRTRLDMTHNPEKWLGRVIEVAHEGVSIGESDSGRFRFPRFKRVRSDRDPASVTTHDE